MLGLISAVRNYDSTAGASFRTYSELCIKRRLLTAIRNAAGGRSVSLDDCLSLESPLFDENQTQAAYAVRAENLRNLYSLDLKEAFADQQKTNLQNANLRKANLSIASLRIANLRVENLRGPEEMVIDREETDKFYAAFLCLLSVFEADVLKYYSRRNFIRRKSLNYGQTGKIGG
jgi:DNA-directed RNA polymerase specialized sigma subunit